MVFEMTDAHPAGDEYQFVGDDVVVPFAVEPLDIRGRAIQIGPLIDTILKRHDYPQDVGFLLAELVTLTVILGSSLKFDGNFILQTQSEGPVSLAVVDFSTPGSVRAYARFDEALLEEARKTGKTSPRELLGAGALAMTIDQGPQTQRYQGIVALDGISLEEVAHQYFRQSEQIPTRVRLSVAQIVRRGEDGTAQMSWRAGGIIAQFFPDSPSRVVVRDLPGGSGDDMDEPAEDDAWVEASSLIATIAEDELTDPHIGSERLLYRLFNEHGVRVFEGIEVAERCSCSREKVVAMLRSFDDPHERNENEDVVTKCEFCSTVYEIPVSDLSED